MQHQLWQYQQKADPLQQDAPPAVPDQPWLRDVVPLPLPRLRVEGLAGPPAIALPYDLPLRLPDPLPRAPLRLVRDTASTSYGQADVVVLPDLIAQELARPLPPRAGTPSIAGTLITLVATPFPGDLATTIVAGTLPCAIIPSGMTPGDDTDG